MIKFAFFTGSILLLTALLGVPSIWQRWIMGLVGLFLVLFSSYIKFYLFSERKQRTIDEKKNDQDEQPSVDLEEIKKE